MAISQEIHQSSMTKINMKITHPKCHLNLPGANELKTTGPFCSSLNVLKGTKIGVNSAHVYLMYLVLMPLFCLTHWRRVTHYTSVKSGIIGTDNHLNQCCLIVNFTLRNKLEWNFNQNSSIFIQENTFENVVCEMAAILSRGRLVNETISSDMCCIHITMPNVL